MKVIILDDDREILKILSDFLIDNGFEVACFNLVKKFWEVLDLVNDEEKIVIVDALLDSKEEAGTDVVCKIKKQARQKVKLIVISGGAIGFNQQFLSKEYLLGVAKRFGADAVFEKPFQLKDFLGTLKHLEKQLIGELLV